MSSPVRGGIIISTASVVSEIGGASTHAYKCLKHGVLGLTKNLVIELGQFGIRVNCLSLYGLATNLSRTHLRVDDEEIEQMTNAMENLKGTTLKVGDIANAAFFLASDDAKYVSGQNLFIDGDFGVFNSAMQVFKDPDS